MDANVSNVRAFFRQSPAQRSMKYFMPMALRSLMVPFRALSLDP
jgi:hypothetical protein